MRQAYLSIRGRLDRFGVLLSGLCMLHCLAGLLLVAGLGLGGADPGQHLLRGQFRPGLLWRAHQQFQHLQRR